MIENIKKHWFVVVVAVIFLVGIIYFATDQINSVLKGKRVDGKDVVSEVNDQDLLADDYYDLLFEEYGDGELYKLFEKATLAAIPVDKEAEENAENDAKNQIQYISAEQGEPGLENLDKALYSLGYDGRDELEMFYQDLDKKEKIFSNYADEHYDKYIKEFLEKNKGRLVSHILINMDDPENPTDEEQKKVDKVNKALEDKNFKEVALELSEDENTAPNKGLLGYMDANTEFQEEFLKEALKLQEGETGTWIKTSFGQHLIYIDSTDYSDFKEDSQFIESIVNTYPEIQTKSVWEKAQDLNIEFENKDVETKLKDYMEIGGE